MCITRWMWRCGISLTNGRIAKKSGPVKASLLGLASRNGSAAGQVEASTIGRSSDSYSAKSESVGPWVRL